jgi:hypothetical protein
MRKHSLRCLTNLFSTACEQVSASRGLTAYDVIAVNDTSAVFSLTLRVVRFGDETVDITISKK